LKGNLFPKSLKTALVAATLFAWHASVRSAEPKYDIIVRGGTIVDGSGLPSFSGDVGVRDGRIVAVGDLTAEAAENSIDASGLIVSPGFINIHSHAQPDAMATAVNMLTQGVTTEIANADGKGSTDIIKQLEEYGSSGLAENIGFYIGFNATWEEAIGTVNRRATGAELARMRDVVVRNLARGAWGVSAGLDYKPAYYAKPQEVVAVVSAARGWQTNFTNHERLRPEEQFSSFGGIAETIRIGEQSGLTPVITHIKSQGREQGNSSAVLKMMDEATRRGVYTAADVYPYLAGQTRLAALLVPDWALEGGREAMLQRLGNPATRARVAVGIEEAMALRFRGPQGVYLLDTAQELTDLMAAQGVSAGEAVIRALEGGDVGAILRFGSEQDLRAFLRYPDSAVACDCGASTDRKAHPRQWGSYPRVLGHYVRENKVLTLEDAVRKMSALPASIVGMVDRGYLAAGMSADIVAFDPLIIADNGTYSDPTKPSEGVRYVIVNGKVALSGGSATGMKSGQPLLRSAHMYSRPMSAGVNRSASAMARLVDGCDKMELSLSVVQDARDRQASGHLQILDHQSGSVWTANQLGILQSYGRWHSLTAVLRDIRGSTRAVTITIEPEDDRKSRSKPIVMGFDGRTYSSKAHNRDGADIPAALDKQEHRRR
jgi:N-acyl-D-aspartate/D-glutamate deacylase